MLTLEVVTCLRLHGHPSAEVHSRPQPWFSSLTGVPGDPVGAGYTGDAGAGGRREVVLLRRGSSVFSNLIQKEGVVQR